MIRMTIERNAATHLIHRFSVDGHAAYADSGKDIVCAGISAITIGTVNAIEALLDVRMMTSTNKGLLQASLPIIEDEGTYEKVQLLLESMIVMADSIMKTYKLHITINEIFI